MLPLSLSYVQARKCNNTYRLYWIGTRNEIFPGEEFRTAGEARMYYKVQAYKSQGIAK